MKKVVFLLSVFSSFCPTLFSIGEKTLSLGGESGWKAVSVWEGTAELRGVRPFSVISLSSKNTDENAVLDLYLSFNEETPSLFRDHAENYTVIAGETVQVAAKRWARKGNGAAMFSGINTVAYKSAGNEPLIITPKTHTALLAPGHNIGDFRLEFFLYPANMASGEEIIDWSATQNKIAGVQNGNGFQSIRCVTAKNRLNWSFENFFLSPDGLSSKNLKFSSKTPLTPGVWSYHIIHFDSATGMLEYLVNDNIEAIVYATASGNENGEVWTPVAGERGSLCLGRQFNGFIDEFKLAGSFSGNGGGHRYKNSSGSMETIPIDLGIRQSIINKVVVSGGAINLAGNSSKNEYRRGGDFRFANGAQMQFFVRAADSRHSIESEKYVPFNSGESIFSVNGRFVQILVNFYPSGDLETTPYVEELKLEYLPKSPPKAPAYLSAVARDGAVELSWKESKDDISGYVVYYGIKQGEYFGTEGGLGASPIDVGKITKIRLDNLKNGVLYYFAVAAYDDSGSFYPGEFSREVSARPLRMLE